MSATVAPKAAPKAQAPAQSPAVLPPARRFADATRPAGTAVVRRGGPPARRGAEERFRLDGSHRRPPALSVTAGPFERDDKSSSAVLFHADETQTSELNQYPLQPGSNIENTVTNNAARRNLSVSRNTSHGAVIQFTQQRTLPIVAPPVITLHRSPGKPVRSPLLKKFASTTITSSGAPLPVAVKNPLTRSFSIDLTPIRVHTDARSQQTVKSFKTRAFAYGNHIFLGPGESPNDLRLMSHEVAHVVQQSGGAVLQHFTTSHGDAFESEAEQASAAAMRGDSFRVQKRTGPRPQGFLDIDLDISIPDPLDWLAGKANSIPGFRMLTIILGVNPINMSSVDRNAANILRAMVEFIPGGSLITEALDNHGIFDKVGAFVETQIDSLGMTVSSIASAVTEFIDSLDLPGDLISPGSTWERAKKIFTDPIDQIISFGAGLVDGIIELIKDAILKPIAKLAEGTEGYNLLKGVLGYDPITDEPVTPSAETLLGPILNMIGLGDVWQKMQQANAIPRAWQWFQSTISTLVSFVSQIPSLFITAFTSLTLEDIILVPRAFAKLVGVFGSFMSSFISWGFEAMFNLLEIVFDVVSPGAFGYVKQTGAALKSILQDPLPFVGNLGKAAKLGFQNFAKNFVKHLKAGLLDWLLGSLPGIYIPSSFSLGEIVKFIFSILGLTWANLRQKLVTATSETVVRAMEAGFDIVKTLVTQGPAAAWDKIQDQLSALKDQVIQGIIDMVVQAVVTKAVPKLVAMFIPGAGFISAIISIYDMVMVFVEKIARIVQVVTAFVNSIVAIAAGNIGAAASKVESILAGLLSLAINFLAGFAGLGKIASKIKGIVERIRAPIDKAMDAIVAWIVGTAKKLGKFLLQAGVPQDPNERLRAALRASTSAARALGGKLTQPLLERALSAIQTRYSLRLLQVFQQGGTWWVRAANSPPVTQSLGVPAVPPAAAPAGPGAWPVSIGNNIKVPNSNRIETVLAIDLTANTITHSFSPRGEPGKHTRPHADFMQLWNAGQIQLTGQLSAAQLRVEYTRLYGADVADAILRRDELANNFALLQLEQAHHIIPVGVLKAQGMMHLLVKSGWNFNAAMNGIPLESGFHGNHPSYNNYVNRKMIDWVAANGTTNTAAFRSYVENQLIPFLRNHINIANAQFKTTGKTLNDYFSTLP